MSNSGTTHAQPDFSYVYTIKYKLDENSKQQLLEDFSKILPNRGDKGIVLSCAWDGISGTNNVCTSTNPPTPPGDYWTPDIDFTSYYPIYGTDYTVSADFITIMNNGDVSGSLILNAVSEFNPDATAIDKNSYTEFMGPCKYYYSTPRKACGSDHNDPSSMGIKTSFGKMNANRSFGWNIKDIYGTDIYIDGSLTWTISGGTSDKHKILTYTLGKGKINTCLSLNQPGYCCSGAKITTKRTVGCSDFSSETTCMGGSDGSGQWLKYNEDYSNSNTYVKCKWNTTVGAGGTPFCSVADAPCKVYKNSPPPTPPCTSKCCAPDCSTVWPKCLGPNKCCFDFLRTQEQCDSCTKQSNCKPTPPTPPHKSLKEFITYPNNFNDISAVLIDLNSIGPNKSSQTDYGGMYKLQYSWDFSKNEQGDSPYGYCKTKNCGFIGALKYTLIDGGWKDSSNTNYYEINKLTDNNYVFHDSSTNAGLLNLGLLLSQINAETGGLLSCDEQYAQWATTYLDAHKKTQVYPLANGGCGQAGRNYTLCDEAPCPSQFSLQLYNSSNEAIKAPIVYNTCTDSSKAIINTLAWDWRIPSLSLETSPINKIPKPYLYGGPIDATSNEASGIIYNLNKYNYRTILEKPAFSPFAAGDLSGLATSFYDEGGEKIESYQRKDVSGCTWWGRGTIQTTGKENYSLLNYLINDIYNINLCDDKSILCNGYQPKTNDPGEPKWMGGILYWLFSVQPIPLTKYRDGVDPATKKLYASHFLWKSRSLGNIQLNEKTLNQWCDAKSTFKDMLDQVAIYINSLNKETLEVDNKELMDIIFFISSFATFCVNGFNADTTTPTGAVISRNNITINMLLALKILHPIQWVEKITYNDAASSETKVPGANWCTDFSAAARKKFNDKNINTSNVTFCNMMQGNKMWQPLDKPNDIHDSTKNFCTKDFKDGSGVVWWGTEIACIVAGPESSCNIGCPTPLSSPLLLDKHENNNGMQSWYGVKPIDTKLTTKQININGVLHQFNNEVNIDCLRNHYFVTINNKAIKLEDSDTYEIIM